MIEARAGEARAILRSSNTAVAPDQTEAFVTQNTGLDALTGEFRRL
jgi:hypothetical protein